MNRSSEYSSVIFKKWILIGGTSLVGITSLFLTILFGQHLLKSALQMSVFQSITTENGKETSVTDTDLKGINAFLSEDLTGAYAYFSQNTRISPYNESIVRIEQTLKSKGKTDEKHIQKGLSILSNFEQNIRAKYILGTRKIKTQQEKIRRLLDDEKNRCSDSQCSSSQNTSGENQSGSTTTTSGNNSSSGKEQKENQNTNESEDESSRENSDSKEIITSDPRQDFETRSLTFQQLLEQIHQKEKNLRQKSIEHTKKGSYQPIEELSVFFSQFIGDRTVFQHIENNNSSDNQ